MAICDSYVNKNYFSALKNVYPPKENVQGVDTFQAWKYAKHVVYWKV